MRQSSPDINRILQECIAVIEVAGQDARHALQERGSGRQDALRGEPVRRLVGVGSAPPWSGSSTRTASTHYGVAMRDPEGNEFDIN